VDDEDLEIASFTRGFATKRVAAPAVISPRPASKIRIKMAQWVTFVYSPDQEPQP
jgi:hypothetical protein